MSPSSSALLIWKVAPQCFVLIVSLLRHRCGVLPQHLDTVYYISDALYAPALASTWLYGSASRPSRFDLPILLGRDFSRPRRRGGFRGLVGPFG